jgi:hypothetical protein
MSDFAELFQSVERPVGDHFPPDSRGQRFPDIVSSSRRFHLFVRGQSIPTSGRVLIVGVVTWSGYDMKLLDRIDSLPDDDLHIEVFDSDTFRTASEVETLIPGINVYAQTPFVGYWVDGVLKDFAAGAFGRKLIANIIGVDPDELNRSVTTLSRPA